MLRPGELLSVALAVLYEADKPMTVAEVMLDSRLVEKRVQFYLMFDNYSRRGILKKTRVLRSPPIQIEGMYYKPRMLSHYEFTEVGRKWFEAWMELRDSHGDRGQGQEEETDS